MAKLPRARFAGCKETQIVRFRGCWDDLLMRVPKRPRVPTRRTWRGRAGLWVAVGERFRSRAGGLWPANLAALLLAALGATCVVAEGPAAPPATSAVAPGHRYELDTIPIDRIAPGTVVGSTPPRGWTHLVIKSRPHLSEKDQSELHGIVVKLATLLSTNLAARVVFDDRAAVPHYYLAKLGLGFSTRMNQRDAIVSSQGSTEQDPGLGVVGKLFLSQMERQYENLRFTVRSRTLAVVDFLGVQQRGSGHGEVKLRYAVVVDHRTGRLETLLWLLEPAGPQAWRLQATHCHWLEPNTVEDYLLHVDPAEFTAGIPSTRAFAIVNWPPGRKLTLGETLSKLAVLGAYTQESAAALEIELRATLAGALRTASPVPGVDPAVQVPGSAVP